jgi:hypothetical protein
MVTAAMDDRTVSVSVPTRPSLVAEITVVPGATADTWPVVDTVATAVLLLSQDTDRSVSSVPDASRSVTAYDARCPTDSVPGPVTTTENTGAPVTVRVADPLCPSLVAVMTGRARAQRRHQPRRIHRGHRRVRGAPRHGRPVRSRWLGTSQRGRGEVLAPTTIVGCANATATVATGACVTVSDAEPLCPSLVAVMMTVPSDSVVMLPDAFTVAIAGFDVVHVTLRPVSTSLLALRSVAVATVVDPTITLEAARFTAMLATGTGVTVSTVAPLCPSLVAVMVVVPGVSAVIAPLALTVATVEFDDVHAIARPVITSLLAVRSVTVAIVVLPTVMFACASTTVTTATGTGNTVSTAEPLCPSLLATMLVVPGVSAVMAPVLDTDATVGLLELHDTARPVSDAPVLLRVSAVAMVLPPTTSCGEPSVTETLATAVGGGGVVGVVGAASPPPLQAASVMRATSRAMGLAASDMCGLRMVHAAMGHPSHTEGSRRGVTVLGGARQSRPGSAPNSVMCVCSTSSCSSACNRLPNDAKSLRRAPVSSCMYRSRRTSTMSATTRGSRW